MKTKFTHRIGICFCFVASVVCARSQVVVADTFLPSLDSLITASSEYGAQGVVEIDSVETDIGGGLVILPDELKDRSVNLAERCALQLQGDVSSFFINGQGGLPVWSRENYLPETIHWERSEE